MWLTRTTIVITIPRDFIAKMARGWLREVIGGEKARVTSAGNLNVLAKAILVATNSPINDRYVIRTKQGPYTTYVIALSVPRGAITRALFWDTTERAVMESGLGPVPYHYVRIANGRDEKEEILIAG